MFFKKLLNIRKIVVFIVVFAAPIPCAMACKPGDSILKEIESRLGKAKVINSSTINSEHITKNHFLGVFDNKNSFVTGQFEIIRRIITTEDVRIFEKDKEILQFIENVGLSGILYSIFDLLQKSL
jgi:hypothetical protein